MTSLYPVQQKSTDPPSYDQATFYSQPPPIPLTFGMYSTTPTVLQPLGTQMRIETHTIMYGAIPVQCTCTHCHQLIVTRAEKKVSFVQWLLCGGIALMGGFLGCCLIPFCIDSAKDIQHYCPNCGILLNTHNQFFDI